jgi:hypothetical protein
LDGYDFHCGDCLDVLIEKDWVKARIEHCTEFYLLLFPFAKPAQAINLDEMLGLIARAGS